MGPCFTGEATLSWGDISDMSDDVSRRKFLGAALATAAMAPLANAQQVRSDDHSQPNEKQPGENNTPLDQENPSSVWSPETDNGTVEPFKYYFALAHKRIEDGGWTRQVTERELPISKTLAGVEMRLVSGGVRELHWHTSAEWAFMIYGNARITAVDAQGRSFVNDGTKGDMWLVPRRYSAFHPGAGTRWSHVPAGLQRWKLQ